MVPMKFKTHLLAKSTRLLLKIAQIYNLVRLFNKVTKLVFVINVTIKSGYFKHRHEKSYPIPSMLQRAENFWPIFHIRNCH